MGGGGGGAAESFLTEVEAEGPAVVLTREEWEREFLTSQLEYLSSGPMLSLRVSE